MKIPEFKNPINTAKDKKPPVLTQESIVELLDTLYSACSNGVPNVSPSVQRMAEDYLNQYATPKEAAQKMVQNQVVKCTTSGFITGFGGIATLPVAIPANLSSVLYVQMRMIAATAHMAGFDLRSDQVQTFVYACLAGVSVNQFVKKVGTQIGEKVAVNMIKKIPGELLTKINQKAGFRLFTKFGSKGAINIGKMIPGVGAIVGGGFDYFETKAIGNRAVKMFFEGDFSGSNDINENDIDFEPEVSGDMQSAVIEEQ